MDLSILTWLKHSKPMHSMPLSWTESLDHLEHVMGPCCCFWAGPHHQLSLFYTHIQGSEVVATPTPRIFIALEQNEQKTTDKSHPQLQNT
jgi:hypothetical protein